MIAAAVRTYRLGEFHTFEGGGRQFLYLVPAGAIFELDTAAATVISLLSEGGCTPEDLLEKLTQRDFAAAEAAELIQELFLARVIVASDSAREPLEAPPADFPLQTLVMNLTNQCNLSCQYCYEFGADKVATPEGKPKFMDLPTAKASVDFLLEQSAGRREFTSLSSVVRRSLNFPLLKQVVTYASQRAGQQGRHIDFSLTTNATLLTPAIIEIPLGEPHRRNRQYGPGPRELHDKLRVFANGKGSYDIIAPQWEGSDSRGTAPGLSRRG